MIWIIVSVGEQPTENGMANKDPVLTFRQFQQRAPDFRGYFVSGFGGASHREEPAYKLCAAENPQFVELSAGLQSRKDDESFDYRDKMHKAYLLMHKYAGSNDELLRRTKIPDQD